MALLAHSPPFPPSPPLQHALNTKTEFFARVSHEFRTPLNIILNFAEEIILNPSLSPYARERVSYIMASGEGLLRIVDDILEVRGGGGLCNVHAGLGIDLPSFLSSALPNPLFATAHHQ